MLVTFFGGYVFGMIALGIQVLIRGGPPSLRYAGFSWIAFAVGFFITRAILKKYFPNFVGIRK